MNIGQWHIPYHFPICVCVGVTSDTEVKKEALSFAYRNLDDTFLNNVNWHFTQEKNITDAFNKLHNILQDYIEILVSCFLLFFCKGSRGISLSSLHLARYFVVESRGDLLLHLFQANENLVMCSDPWEERDE